MTRFEKIKNMDISEMAKLLMVFHDEDYYRKSWKADKSGNVVVIVPGKYPTPNFCEEDYAVACSGECEECIKRWLESEEDEDDE